MTAVLCMIFIPLGVLVFAALCGWAQGDFSASAIEARRAATENTGAVHESAVPNGETPE